MKVGMNDMMEGGGRKEWSDKRNKGTVNVWLEVGLVSECESIEMNSASSGSRSVVDRPLSSMCPDLVSNLVPEVVKLTNKVFPVYQRNL